LIGFSCCFYDLFYSDIDTLNVSQIPLNLKPASQIPLNLKPASQIPLNPKPASQIPLNPKPASQIPLNPKPAKLKIVRSPKGSFIFPLQTALELRLNIFLIVLRTQR